MTRTAVPRSGRREWVGLAILAVVVLRDVGSGAEREGADMLDEERSESRDERHLEAGGIVAASEG